MHPTELVSRRRRLRVTQAQLAAYLGVTKSTVWRWESGRAAPPPMVQQLLRLADQMPVDVWAQAVRETSGQAPAGAGRWPT